MLAPVGTKEAFQAAVQNRADAVYLAGKSFGARAYADNFSNEEIGEMIAFAHLFGVKVYVTVNTVVFDEEFSALEEFLDFLYLHDCDAVIVQDLGVANFISHRYPDFPMHASTQMNIHSLDQALVLKKLGFKRVILAREQSLSEVAEIKKHSGLEIEVFAHGALCVSCSGNCYLSSIIGKRSGNRGRCAQPCRTEYTLNGRTEYFLSPKDLNVIEYIDQLAEAGIDALKIEGRMKRPEYVAQVVASYKTAIDAYCEKKSWPVQENINALKSIFNRQFTKGFLLGEKNADFSNSEFSNHIGIKIGEVTFSSPKWVRIRLDHELSSGDAIRIKGENVDGVVINQMYLDKTAVKFAPAGSIIQIKPHLDKLLGAEVFLTTDIAQIESLRKTYDQNYRQVEVDGEIFLKDDHLGLKLSVGGITETAESENPVQPSANPALNDRIIEQIGKTATTVFRFRSLKKTLDRPVFLPIKDINELRRRALESLKRRLGISYPNRKIQPQPIEAGKPMALEHGLNAKVRSSEQLKAAAAFPFDQIYVTSQELLSEAAAYPSAHLLYVTPRINKHGQPKQPSLVSDLSAVSGSCTSIYMNVVNSLSVNLLERLGAKRIGLSLEMSETQIKNLIAAYQTRFQRKPNLEMMVYGRYELMMLKYCPISAHFGCGSCPARNDTVLTDRRGFEFPVFKDDECYVKILNGKKLHLIEYVDELYDMGVNNLLLDFTTETAAEVEVVSEIYFRKSGGKKIENVTYGHFQEGVL